MSWFNLHLSKVEGRNDVGRIRLNAPFPCILVRFWCLSDTSVIKQPTEEGFSERSERPRTGPEALQQITATTAAQRLRKVHFLLKHSENILLPNEDQHILNIPVSLISSKYFWDHLSTSSTTLHKIYLAELWV